MATSEHSEDKTESEFNKSVVKLEPDCSDFNKIEPSCSGLIKIESSPFIKIEIKKEELDETEELESHVHTIDREEVFELNLFSLERLKQRYTSAGNSNKAFLRYLSDEPYSKFDDSSDEDYDLVIADGLVKPLNEIRNEYIVKAARKEGDVKTGLTLRNSLFSIDKENVINPKVTVKFTWKDELNEVTTRKFNDLTFILDLIVEKYKQDPNQIQFIANGRKICLQGETYVSLRFDKNTKIKAVKRPSGNRSKKRFSLMSVSLQIRRNRRKGFRVYLLPDDNMEMMYAQVMKKLRLKIEQFKLFYKAVHVMYDDTMKSLNVHEDDAFDLFMNE